MARKRIVEDTSDFFSIDCGDEILVGGRHYRITGHEKERRFGIDDPKFWVKKAQDAETGEKRLIKLSYFESFYVNISGVKIRCFRNPDKEGEILDIVRGHPHFMQGRFYRDPKGNNIRILEIVNGSNLFVHIHNLAVDHKTYFYKYLPDMLRHLVPALQAIIFLHKNGYRHGDIRNDHLIMERETGNYVWIDFDYDFESGENPFSLDIFGLGNILLCMVGKGIHTLYEIDGDRKMYGDLMERVDTGDFSLLDKWRLVNLQKLYPYIPDSLNNIIMHFSQLAEVYYESVEEIVEDLNRYLKTVSGHQRGDQP